MENYTLEIKAYTDRYRHQILNVWEQSVLATHDFLSPSDFHEIKNQVQSIDFNQFEVYCLTKNELVVGFLGVADHKIEMLFIAPEWMGKGFGKTLMEFATNKLAANCLDVNLQNESALKFYQKFGFEIYEITEKDDQGRNYPLARMRLKNN